MRCLITRVIGQRLVEATVRGRSMQPTYHDGDRLLVLRRRRYHRGDVIVFRVDAAPGHLSCRVKRVVAVAGDAQRTGPST
jgi:signal peptidase I